jgi:hypothetical protein
MPAAPTHAEAVRAAIAAMDGTLALARALVEAGRRVDLAGLDADAAALCAAVMALDSGPASLLRPDLEALLRQLDGLGASLAAA